MTKLPLHHLPSANQNFVGRRKQIAQLSAILSTDCIGTVAQAITGLGGIGKTQLVLQYAYEHINDYSFIYWFNAESSLDQEFKDLAEKIGISTKYRKAEEIRELVKGEFESVGSLLLIFDNVESFEKLNKYIPKGKDNCHVLITSRLNSLPTNWKRPIRLGVLERQESIDLIGKYIFDDIKNKGQFKYFENNLAEVLGDLPLAIIQASSFIGENGSLEEYLQIFGELKLKLLHENQPSDYHATVLTTWEISVNKIKGCENSDKITEIIDVCAYLAPDYIPKSLLIEWMPSISTSHNYDKFLFKKVINVISNYSLVEETKKYLFIHRLLQDVIRESHSNTRKAGLVNKILIVIESNFIFERFEESTWKNSEYLINHALSIINYVDRRRVSHLVFVKLLNKVGQYLQHQKGALIQAEALLKESLSIVSAVQEPDELTICLKAQCYSVLGWIYWDHGNINDALYNLKTSLLGIRDVNNNIARKIRIYTYNGLGLIYWNQSKLINSENSFRNSLEILDDELLFSFPGLLIEKAISYGGLGWSFWGRDIGKSHRFFLASYKIWKKIFNSLSHPDISTPLNGLGWIYIELMELENAEKCFKKAIRIRTNFYQKDHPMLAHSYDGLGRVCLYQGRLDEAESFFDLTLSIRNKNFGRKNLLTIAYPTTGLGLVSLERGDFERAEKKFKESLQYYRKLFGNTDIARKNHFIGDIYYAFSKLYSRTKQYDKAELSLKLFLEIYLNCYRDSELPHPYIDRAYRDLNTVLKEQKKDKS